MLDGAVYDRYPTRAWSLPLEIANGLDMSGRMHNHETLTST